MDETPVIIIGGGPVGLATALDLAWRGRRSTVLEQDPGTGLVMLAKAGTLNERTLEILRRWGMADAVANYGFPDDFPRDNIYCTSLNGFLIGRDPVPSTRDRKLPEGCTEMLRKCPQFVFDPMLAKAVLDTGLVDLRYNARFDDIAQDAEGVTVTYTDRTSGRRVALRAPYAVACDGSASRARESLGIAFDGLLLSYSVSAMVKVGKLSDHHPLPEGERYMFIGEQGTWANLSSVDGKELWRFTLIGSDHRVDLEKLDMTAEIRRAFGREDIPFEVLRYMPWRRSQGVARTFRAGRVLLAGDSAHTTSPTGGHGLNTGLGDSWGAGWMLDALLGGWGGPGLLEAYGAERKPVAIRNSSTSTRNFNVWTGSSEDWALVMQAGAAGDAARARVGAHLSASLYQEWHSLGVGMGYRYEGSPIIVADGTPATPDDPSVYIQTARPGHRAPHVWLAPGRSTIDLFGKSFVLLRFGATPADSGPLEAAASACGMPLQVVDIDHPEAKRLYERRMVLVRPDDHVAWRGDTLPADAQALIDTVRGARQAGAA